MRVTPTFFKKTPRAALHESKTIDANCSAAGRSVIMVAPRHPLRMEYRARLMAVGIDVFQGENGVPAADYVLVLVPSDIRGEDDVAMRLSNIRQVFPDAEIWFVNLLPTAAPTAGVVAEVDVEDMHAQFAAARIGYVTAVALRHAS